MVLRDRYRKLAREDQRRESNREWVEWLKRRDEAQARGEPFDEPNPAERDAKNSQNAG